MTITASSKEVLGDPTIGNHFVQVYQDCETLTGAVCHFISACLRPDEAVLVIAVASHIESFKTRLLEQGTDLAEAEQSGQYHFLDANVLLDSFMSNGKFDAKKARAGLDVVIARIDGYRSAKVYGELVDILWQRGHKDCAATLENHWNSLLKQRDFSLLCAYYVDNLDPAAYCGDLECLCASHTHFLPSQDSKQLDKALAKACENVMGVSLSGMMKSIAKFPHPTTIMPATQASLLYISKTMPITTEFILGKMRSQLLTQAKNT